MLQENDFQDQTVILQSSRTNGLNLRVLVGMNYYDNMHIVLSHHNEELTCALAVTEWREKACQVQRDVFFLSTQIYLFSSFTNKCTVVDGSSLFGLVPL